MSQLPRVLLAVDDTREEDAKVTYSNFTPVINVIQLDPISLPEPKAAVCKKVLIENYQLIDHGNWVSL